MEMAQEIFQPTANRDEKTAETPPLETRQLAEQEVVSLPEEAWSPSRFMEALLRHPEAFFKALAEGKMVGTSIKRLFSFSAPNLPFQIFRPVEGNFFTAVLKALVELLRSSF